MANTAGTAYHQRRALRDEKPPAREASEEQEEGMAARWRDPAYRAAQLAKMRAKRAEKAGQNG